MMSNAAVQRAISHCSSDRKCSQTLVSMDRLFYARFQEQYQNFGHNGKLSSTAVGFSLQFASSFTTGEKYDEKNNIGNARR